MVTHLTCAVPQEYQKANSVPIAKRIHGFIPAGDPANTRDLTGFVKRLTRDGDLFRCLQIPDLYTICTYPHLSIFFDIDQ
jgi:hypothetical protein